MRFIEVHISTNYGSFLFKLNPIFAGSLPQYIARMKRSIEQGSVGCNADHTVGNSPQYQSSLKPQILSCHCSVITE